MSDIALCFLLVLLAFFLWLSWEIYGSAHSGFGLLLTGSVSLILVSALWTECRERVARSWECHRERTEHRDHKAAIVAHAENYNRVLYQQYDRLNADIQLVSDQLAKLTRLRAQITSHAAVDLIEGELKKLRTLRSRLAEQKTKMREFMERSYLQHEVGKQQLARQVLSPNTTSVAEIAAELSLQSLRKTSP